VIEQEMQSGQTPLNSVQNSALLILASASPRRRELLAQAGFSFEVVPADVPEVRKPGEDPIRFVTRLAREKAEAVAASRAVTPDTIVLGADTIVVVDEEVLGKPQDAAEAARMLRLLSGQTHQVITGVCLAKGRERQRAAEVTFVRFATLSDEEIDAYVATGEPLDKAGAYAIQGRAGRWVPRIHGCYFNVVGLPLALVSSMIEAMQGGTPPPSRPERLARKPLDGKS
jgi:septum formation protein